MEKIKIKDWFWFFAPRFILLTLVLGAIIRVALILHPVTVVDWGFWDWIKIVFLGFLNDVAFSFIALIPAFIFYSVQNDFKFSKPRGYILWGFMLLLTLYVVLCNDITDEYGGPLPRIVNAVLIFITTCYSIKLFVPKTRAPWRTASIFIFMMIYISLAVTIACSEIVFWSEFGVRFNFIAVDYLVYTNEVVGNIVESYPIVWMFLALFAVSAGICWLFVRRYDIRQSGVGSFRKWALTLVSLVICCFLGGKWLHLGYRNFVSDNAFATQIHQNGCWDFLEAFVSNRLDYEQFYAMADPDRTKALQRELCHQNEVGIQEITSTEEPIKKNVVLITVESLSADFLGRYGNTYGITPNLDSLAAKGLVFDNLFATGNRTVRGLEALSLCLPPSAGESLIKRPDCNGYYSVGDVFRNYGYRTSFIYGGDSYFDNMGAFFGNCGYEILDKKTYDKEAIVFSNIWGTSDEDSYREAIGRFDGWYAAGEPFFAHIMTISNHRPYTYPENRIEYDGNPMSRRAAVKYTDWAIGKFISDASEKPWFGDTIFIIVADHCASSAGKTSLPVECYHIPAIVYSPGFIEPQAVGKTCSQIDLMPTVFSLLHFSYSSPFYGQDILADDFRKRAFMATYQDLGYYSDDILTVLSPVRKIQQFKIERTEGWEYSEQLMDTTREDLLLQAQAYYQTSAR